MGAMIGNSASILALLFVALQTGRTGLATQLIER